MRGGGCATSPRWRRWSAGSRRALERGAAGRASLRLLADALRAAAPARVRLRGGLSLRGAAARAADRVRRPPAAARLSRSRHARARFALVRLRRAAVAVLDLLVRRGAARGVVVRFRRVVRGARGLRELAAA